MKKVGILSVAIALGFTMSSSFAFWGTNDDHKVEFKDIKSGETQSMPISQKVQSGSTVKCVGPNIVMGSIKIQGLDKVYTLKQGTSEISGVYSPSDMNKPGMIMYTASPDLKLSGRDHYLKCTFIKMRNNNNHNNNND